MREEPRFKAIVIPKIGNKYVVVKDKKYGEYTFVIGGCKLNEPSTACALRELAEEYVGQLLSGTPPGSDAADITEGLQRIRELQRVSRRVVRAIEQLRNAPGKSIKHN